MNIVFKSSDGSGIEREVTDDEAMDLLVRCYRNSDTAKFHFEALKHGRCATVSVENGALNAQLGD